MAGARQIVDPPAFTPLPYGLWDSIQHPTPSGPHWQQGITWIERCPDGGTTYDECLSVTGTGEAPPEPPAKADNVEQTVRGATPFTVFAEFDCSPVGLNDAATAAREALARVESQQVERAFFSGIAGGQTIAYPHLAADTEVVDGQGIVLQPVASPVVTGADVDITDGLGRLESALSDCYGGQGFIHIPHHVLPMMAAWNLAIERDGGLYTPAGNRIVVGSGFENKAPDGTPAEPRTAWVYATGQVFGYRSEVFFTRARESIDRAENTYRMLAERTYVIGFECCLIATQFALGVIPAGAITP
jgi:hypothetical protein